MDLSRGIKKFLKTIVYGVYDTKKVYNQVTDPQLSQSYYPGEPRKSKFTIWKDLMVWQLKHHEVNRLYFAYGLDRKNIDSSHIIPYRKFNRLRDSRNQQLPREQFNYANESYNYVCLLRDKFIFALVLKSLGFPTPRNIAIFNKAEFTWLENMQAVPLESVLQDTQMGVDGFAKKLTGILGAGAFTLRIEKGKFFIQDREVTLEDLRNKIDGQYLLQERVTQHPEMAKLHPSSVNTIRLVTVNNAGHVQPLTAALRIGAKGRSVDNWASGGIVTSINLDTGLLEGEGLFKPGYGAKVTVHPDTGVVLEGFKIPYFTESVALACKLHTYLYGIHSIGWDIAVTSDGPVLIEGNDDWEGGIPMALDSNFKAKLFKMYESSSGR